MKMYRENFGFNNFNKKMLVSIFSVFIFIFVAFLSVGFAAFQTTLIMKDISAEIKYDVLVRVSNFKVSSPNNNAVAQNTDYNYNRIYGDVLLPNANSSVTYEVEVVNLGNTKAGISSITGLSNNLEYTITGGYECGDPIKNEDNQYTLGAVMKFYITIQYANGAMPTQDIQSFNLVLDFREFHSITYHGIPGEEEGRPYEIMDGFDLVIETELTSIDRLKVTQDTAFLVYGEHYEYDETINQLTVKNVSGDLLLSYRDTTYLTDLSSDIAYFKESKFKNTIKNVAFVNYVNVPEDREAIYDLSEAKDNSIVGWITANDDATYNLYIGSVYDIYTKNFGSAFKNMTGIKSITFENLDTSESTSFAYTFYKTQIEQLDLSTFSTINATTMLDMFGGMSKLETLDVSNFNTSKVRSMYYMFGGLTKITELDISSFNTSSVTNMGSMFSGMTSLTTLKLGNNFNTALVSDMQYMFNGLTKITSLDLSTFKTHNLKNATNMFNGCTALTSLDLSTFTTEKLENTSYMFSGCRAITELDLSTFTTEKVADMTNMFYDMSALTTLNISNFNTTNVTTMESMFQGCTKLASLDLKNFNTAQVTTMQNMFSAMSSLKTLDLSTFELTSVGNMSNFLFKCSKLEKLYFNIAEFNSSIYSYNNFFFSGNPKGFEVTVKDTPAETWIRARLTEALGEGVGTIIVLNPDPELEPEGVPGTGEVIPEGATYKTYVNGRFEGEDWVYDSITTYNAGDNCPETIKLGDMYIYGNYEYRYNLKHYALIWNEASSQNGWGVYCINNIESPDSILESINGRDIVSLSETFDDCESIVTAPVILNNITDMTYMFNGCTSLTGTITIHANPTSYEGCFNQVDFKAQNITLAGDSTMLDEIGATGENYCAECNGTCLENH